MKQKTFWTWVTVIVIIAVALMWADDLGAAIGQSRDGWENVVTFATDIDCDSARIYFIFPDTIFPHVSTVDTSIKLSPWVQDSSILRGTGLALDSTIMYLVRTAYYPQDSASPLYDTSYWYHEGPGRITAASPSGSYVCRVYGYLSDISSAYVKNAVVSYKIDKQMVYDTCSHMIVFKKDGVCSPTGTSGYFEFDAIRSYCIKGQKYTVTVSKPGVPTISKTIEITDSATYYMTWGN